MTLSHTVRDAVSSLPARLRPHALPLALLTAVTLMSVIALSIGTRVFFDVDSPSYIDLANQYFHGQIISVFRTPGYPLFLKMIFLVVGKNHFKAVVVAQMALMLLTVFEIYILVYRLTASRWGAAIVTAFVGANIYIISWGWSILTESLAFWGGVTVLLLFERYLKTERLGYLIAVGLMAFATILIRPIFIYLPPMLLIFLVIWSLRNHKMRWQWKHVVLMAILVYGPLLGYMSLLAYKAHFFGVSNVSNVNLVEKIMEYRMQTLPGAPQYADIQQRMIDYYNSGQFFKSGPWQFVLTEPGLGTGWSRAGAFCVSIIERHPVEYLSHTIEDAQRVWLAPPLYYGVFPNSPINQLLNWFAGMVLLLAYLLLPAALIFFLILTWRKRDDLLAYFMLLLSLVVGVGIFTVAADASEQFYRLRFPMDWGAIVVTGTALYLGIRLLMHKDAPAAPTTDTHREPTSEDDEVAVTLKRAAVHSNS